MHITALIGQLASNAGDLWFLALLGSFFVMICEAAKPKPQEGESRAEPQGIALFVMILSLVTPLLLFIHAFMTASGALMTIVAAIGGAVVLSAVIGWIVGWAAPSFGRTLSRAAPYLAVIVFALTLYVSWRSAFAFVQIFVG